MCRTHVHQWIQNTFRYLTRYQIDDVFRDSRVLKLRGCFGDMDVFKNDQRIIRAVERSRITEQSFVKYRAVAWIIFESSEETRQSDRLAHVAVADASSSPAPTCAE